MSDILQYFPTEFPNGTVENINKANMETFAALTDLAAVTDIFNSVPREWQVVSNIAEGISYSVDVKDNEVTVTFHEDNQLMQEVFSGVSTTTRRVSEETSQMNFSPDGVMFNDGKLQRFMDIGANQEVGKVHLAFEKMMSIIARTMLLHPDKEIQWMTGLDAKSRENDQPSKVLDAIIRFGIASLPVNMRFLRNMLEDAANIEHVHQLNWVTYNEQGERITGPFMNEHYNVGFDPDHVNEKGIKLTHSVNVEVLDSSKSPNSITELSGEGITAYTDEIITKRPNFDYNAIAVAQSRLNSDRGDRSSLFISFTSKNQLAIRSGSAMYSIDYTNDLELKDASGIAVDIKNLPIREKIMLVKLLVVAPSMIKDSHQ